MARLRFPGVFIEEVNSRPVTIKGVPTGTAAFVGYARRGPFATETAPQLLTSAAHFEQIYGAPRPAARVISKLDQLAHAARAFFAEGGRRLFVARVHPAGARLRSVSANVVKSWEKALRTLRAVEEISLVAAPGATEEASAAVAIQRLLIAHAGAAGGHRFAVLDIPRNSSVTMALAHRGRFDSSFAAFYHPWVIGRETAGTGQLPPSGFVCGLLARSDRDRGVWKAPANLGLRGAAALAGSLSSSELGELNSAGINGFRMFPSRGVVLWGARTATTDPSLRYVNVRRFLGYLKRSIELGTQWARFEPNDESLWNRIRAAIGNFLTEAWRKGAFPGVKTEEAFFVRCNRSTMTSDDIANGRLICQIGVALVRPAEFIILRIVQKTAPVA